MMRSKLLDVLVRTGLVNCFRLSWLLALEFREYCSGLECLGYEVLSLPLLRSQKAASQDS